MSANPHALLIANLRAASARARNNRSLRTRVRDSDLREAANAIESLSARVAELEPIILDRAGDWQGGGTDTGLPHVTTLDPTPLGQIEARLAALEAREATPAGVDPAAAVCPSPLGCRDPQECICGAWEAPRPVPDPVACSMCGSTTRSRCGRLGCV